MVTDSTGAAVPNVKVTVTEVNTGISRVVQTSENGNYVFPALDPGVVTEAITATAEVPMLQTDRADTGRKIESVQIADMPLAYNRNYFALRNLAPGTTRVFQSHSEFFNSQGAWDTQLNGVSRLANNVQLEGMEDNHRTGLLTVLGPPIEALETVDVSPSNYEAELGRAGGAVINLILNRARTKCTARSMLFTETVRWTPRKYVSQSSR